MTLPIHPETKVGALLDSYPDLEAVLISVAPAFEKLNNPILRKTVEKVTTLDQAARISGVPVRELVHKLRLAAGQPVLPDTSPFVVLESAEAEPPWFAAAVISESNDIDGGALLAQGIHPLALVKQKVAALAPGQTLLLRTPFRPVPLIDTLRSSQVEVFSVQEAPTAHLTYFHVR
jgi:hypothetical protein